MLTSDKIISEPNAAKCAIVVLTKNEAQNLPSCLNAVPTGFARFVIDSGSEDGTTQIAHQLGCVVLSHPWSGFAGQRNYALQHVRESYDWALFIDADEIYMPTFFNWLREFLNNEAPFDVVQISSVLVMGGRQLRYAPGYPVFHPRLVRTKRDVFVPNSSNHGETVLSDAVVYRLDIPYEHHFVGGDLTPWLEKHIRLASAEVRGPSRKADGVVTPRSRLNQLVKGGPLRAIIRFLYHYILRGGFLDGSAGLRYSVMYAWYEVTKWLLTPVK